jgi:hypothetical protein
MNADQNDLHISGDSRCKNAGDPNADYDYETDIDGEARIHYGRVDIGADEYYWSPADYDEDGRVNFIDFTSFAQKWHLTDANISLDDDNDVDFLDLSLFCADWLWEKAWTEGWMMCMGGGGDNLLEKSSSEKIVSEKTNLMLSTAAESLAKRPQRLAARSQKFYVLTPATTISARQRELESLKAADRISVKEILQWLDELWQTDEELKALIDEADWQEFIELVKSSQ